MRNHFRRSSPALLASVFLAGCQTLANVPESETAAVTSLAVADEAPEKPVPSTETQFAATATVSEKAEIGLPGLNTAWPFAGGAIGNNPGHLVLGGAGKWQVKPTGRDKQISLTTAPVSRDGIIVVGDNRGTVYALSSANGAVLWSTKRKAKAEQVKVTSVALMSGTAVVSRLDGTLSGYAVTDGERLWTHDLKLDAAVPLTLRDGRVFAALNSKGLIAIDPKSGEHETVLKLSDEIATVSPLEEGFLTSAKTGDIALLSTGDVGEIWRSAKPDAKSEAVKPIATQDSIFVATGTSLARQNRKTGALVWSKPQPARGDITVSGNAVFAVTSDNRLVALKQSDGAELWSRPLPSTDGAPSADKTARERWSKPVLAAGRLHLTSNTGYVASFEAADGSLFKLRTIGVPVIGGPIVASGRLYIATGNGVVARL